MASRALCVRCQCLKNVCPMQYWGCAECLRSADGSKDAGRRPSHTEARTDQGTHQLLAGSGHETANLLSPAHVCPSGGTGPGPHRPSRLAPGGGGLSAG